MITLRETRVGPGIPGRTTEQEQACMGSLCSETEPESDGKEKT